MCVISIIHYFLGRFIMNENSFKEGLKDIQYVKVKAPVFEIHAYNIKAGKGEVKIGG